MSESLQELLKKAWRGGRRGTLSALEEAKAWALREAWRANGKGDYGLHTFVAERVTKVGGGHPGRDAIRQFFLKVDSDVEWYPGKTTQEQHGPASVITPTKQAAVARSAMAMKDRGVEPTYANVVAANKYRTHKRKNTYLALNTGHILLLRRKTCALLRAKTSALLRRKTCAVLRARTCALFRANTKEAAFGRLLGTACRKRSHVDSFEGHALWFHCRT